MGHSRYSLGMKKKKNFDRRPVVLNDAVGPAEFRLWLHHYHKN